MPLINVNKEEADGNIKVDFKELVDKEAKEEEEKFLKKKSIFTKILKK